MTFAGLDVRGNEFAPVSRVIASADSSTREKLASMVARDIESSISRAGWPIGESLGSEANLIARYGVSRAVLREGIRLVEHHGVASMRRGPSGGLTVTAPDIGPAVRAVVLHLEYVGTTSADLMHARLILESTAAALAARTIDERGIARLRQGLVDEAVGNASHPPRVVSDPLHKAVADASGNSALRLFIEVLTALTARYSAAPSGQSSATARANADAVTTAHAAIVSAIVEGNAERAQRRMISHLKAVEQALVPRPPQSRGGSSAGAQHPGKLAERVAQQIFEDIVDADWPIGQVIGSETELLGRYCVSRAALREAVRLLEHHSIAKMRRGHHGGLIVTAPDPTASVVTMALHLDYKGAAPDEIRVARNAVELGCLDLVLARADDPIVAARLRESLRVHVRMSAAEVNYFSHALHAELGELSGNPVLALFARILTVLWARHSSHEPGPDAVPKIAKAVERTHQAIVDAILDRDSGLARHRMSRHLEALTEWWQ